jgi:hypothetical protein
MGTNHSTSSKETGAEEPLGANTADKAAVLNRIISELAPLDQEDRRRMVEMVSLFFGLSAHPVNSAADNEPSRTRGGAPTRSFRFSESEDVTPKQFLMEKAPSTDVERVTCLAYYLAHNRGVPHFKTKDITALNTEAAQRRFSNAAYAVENAAKSGYLVPSVKGCKQLSAAGEQFVLALPDRDSARQAMLRMRPKRVLGGTKRGPGRQTEK